LQNAFEFAKRFVEKYPRGALFFSSSPVMRNAIETHIAKENIPRVTFFPTSYNLLELAALSSGSRLVITPDTSVIHFGTISNKPTLVLWPDPEYMPMEWIPFQVPSLNLAPDVLGMRVQTISVDDVWNAAQKLLDGIWTHSATSYGLNPESDPLYQAEFRNESLDCLVKRSRIPMVLT
jgi:ADP-heptose:LPS heptosyltransferase